MTYWLELNTGWRRNGANTWLATPAASPPTAEKLCPALDKAEGYLDSQQVRETPYEKT
ncbi:hypothetical protein METHPM2_80060 [Pseudomonas sp. PM2]